MKRRLRVLVAEDSLTVRKRLCEILAADPQIEVVGEAGDGRAAIELCSRLRPDIMTLDMVLPVMSGLAVTEYVMAHFPTPILIVSASTNRGDLFKTYEALAAGAVDVLEKAVDESADGPWERALVAAVKLVARIRVITHLRGRLASPPQPLPARVHALALSPSRHRVVALAASTGGPGALVQLLRGLDPGFSLPILLVLHLNEAFALEFANWLDAQTARRVAYAKDGDSVNAHAGRVAMAPANRHMVVRDRRLWLTDEAPRQSCRPSADVLFESVASDYGSAAAACLLTGMGSDGAAGLLQIRQAGGMTIAQDEATCVVYGMPRAAALMGAAEQVLALGQIAPALSALQASKEQTP